MPNKYFLILAHTSSVTKRPRIYSRGVRRRVFWCSFRPSFVCSS